MLQVDDPDNPCGAHDGGTQHGLKGIFGKMLEGDEAGIFRGFGGDGHRFAVLGHPADDALPEADIERVDEVRVWIARGAQDELILFKRVDEAGVAGES